MVSMNKLTMCRLCLSENVCFIDIFEFNDCQGYVVAEAISDFLKFQVSESDGYPHVVCSKCLMKLTDFRQFKECCQTSMVTYDNMFVPRKNLEEHKPEMVDFVTVKAEPIYCSENEGNDSEAIIKQEELDISGDEYEKPFVGTNTEERLIESEAFVSVDAVELPATSMEDFTQEADHVHSGSELCEDLLKEESSNEELTNAETVTNHKYLQCLEDKRPHCTSRVEIDADDWSWSISTINESTFVKSKNTSLSEDVEASSSGTMERWERQRILQVERMYMAPPFQQDISIRKEVEKERGRTEEDTGGDVEGLSGNGPEDEAGERLECFHCGIVLTSKLGLKQHMKLHGFINCYECAVCGEAFCFNSEFKRHILTHTGSKQYKCAECSKSFSHNGDLERHMVTHTGSKLYKCTVCSKSFSGNSALRRHMKLHTGSKPYKCAECSKCFSQNHHLITHMRVHTGSKPYKCENCFISFSDISNFKRHMKKHAGSKPYKCAVCSKCYSQNVDLKRHMISHNTF